MPFNFGERNIWRLEFVLIRLNKFPKTIKKVDKRKLFLLISLMVGMLLMTAKPFLQKNATPRYYVTSKQYTPYLFHKGELSLVSELTVLPQCKKEYYNNVQESYNFSSYLSFNCSL